MSEDNEANLDQAWDDAMELQLYLDENSISPGFTTAIKQGYQELSQYTFSVTAEPTPSIITSSLAKVQSYKERVSFMYILASNMYGVCKRTFDAAYENAYLEVDGKNMAEKEYRARNQFRSQYNLLCRAQEYMNACKQVLDQLKSTQEILSRQITILQLQLELGSVSRGVLNTPDPLLDSPGHAELKW